MPFGEQPVKGTKSATLSVGASDTQDVAGCDYVCDGTCDEVEINAAIAALPAQGGLIYLCEGTYNVCGPITIDKDNIAIIGAGASTVIRIRDGHDVDINVIEATNFDNLLIKDLRIDGNRANQTAGAMWGIYFSGVTRSKVTKCWIESLQSFGIETDGSTGNTFSDNVFRDMGATGIRLDDASNENLVIENIVEGNTVTGIDIDDSNYNIVVGNEVFDNGPDIVAGAGIYVLRSHYNTLEGNSVHDNAYHGIYINGSHNTVIGNTIINNSLFADNGYDGIYIEVVGLDTSDYNSIQGNLIRTTVAAPPPNRQQYGIYISSGTGNLVANNDLHQSGQTAGYNDAGTITRGTVTGEVSPTGNTLVVAASNSLDPVRADYYCVPPETLVFGNPEVKPITEFQVGERVLTHAGEYKPIVQQFVRPFDGNLISVKPFHGEEIRATPNHPVLAVRVKECPYAFRKYCDRFGFCSRRDCVSPYTGRVRYGAPKCGDFVKDYRPEWVPLGDVKEGDYVLLSFPTEVRDKKSIRLSDYIGEERYVRKGSYLYGSGFNQHGAKQRNPMAKPVPDEIEITPEFMKLAGYYLSEGSTNGNLLQFSFNRCEEQYIKETKELMFKLFGLKSGQTFNENATTIYFSSTLLSHLFEELFGRTAPKKRIPQWMLLLPVDKQKPLIDGLVNGDGYRNEKKTQFVTTSKQLAYFLRLILLRAGIVNSMWKVKPKDGCIKGRKVQARHEKWELVWRNSYGCALIKDGYLWMKVREKKEIPYNGPVYNLKVAESNSYNVVGASLHNCDGASDETEINAAITALGATGGTVKLLEGTFTVDGDIVLASNVALVGQGAGTVITIPDGHDVAINIIYATGRTRVLVKDLRVDGNRANQTAGVMRGIHFNAVTHSKVSNCWVGDVYGGDGIRLVQSGHNHIRGNSSRSNYCGIYILGTPDISAYNIVEGNTVHRNDRHGIVLDHTAEENIVSDNEVVDNGLAGDVAYDGIFLEEADRNHIHGNTIRGTTEANRHRYGINVSDAGSADNMVKDNDLYNAGQTANFNDAGTRTRLPELWVNSIFDDSDANASLSNFINHVSISMADGFDVTVRFNFRVPSDFHQLVRARVVVVPDFLAPALNLRRGVEARWGECGELANAGSGTIAAGEVAVEGNETNCLDIDAALAGITAGDHVGVAFTRYGSHANDTVAAAVHLFQFWMQYV